MNYYRQSPFASLTPVVKNLIIINVIFYLATLVFRHLHIDLVAAFAAFYFDSPLFKPWQVITYMFMHDPDDFRHILFNMFALFIFGPTLENTLGSKRFFNFYFITGIGALLANAAVQAFEIHNFTGAFTQAGIANVAGTPAYYKVLEIYQTPILGASGAIFGVLAGFGMLFPNVELFIMFIPVPIKAKYVIIGYIVIELYAGLGQAAGDSVAHFAHLGGALFGFIMIKIWGLTRRDNLY